MYTGEDDHNGFRSIQKAFIFGYVALSPLSDHLAYKNLPRCINPIFTMLRCKSAKLHQHLAK